MQIKTRDFQLIFPVNFYQEANRVANLFELMYSEIAKDYDVSPGKISIVLYNESVLSNGYVAWAPKRSEWFTLPPQSSYSQDWLEQLVLHETRHVVQLNNLEQGLTRVLNYVFGEAATAAVASFLPFWFLEGDAVLSETMYSNTGRGRSGDFSREIRTIELDRSRRYSYDQSYLGSYRYAVPNYYQYGYHMIAYANAKYGSDTWNQTIKNTGELPVQGAPFYFGLKSQGIRSKEKLYHHTYDSLKQIWNNNLPSDDHYKPVNYLTIRESREYTQYLYVQNLGDQVFAVKTGIDDLTRFVLLTDSTEEILYTPGLYYRTKVSASDKYVAWEEVDPDLRWEKRNYSVIKVLDIRTGKVRKLQDKTRWFSPQLFLNSDSLLCVSVSTDNQFSIIIWDILSERIIRMIPIQGISNLICPVWISKDEVAYISLDQKGKNLMLYDLSEDKISVIFRAGSSDINNLAMGQDYLYFTADDGTLRNIFGIGTRCRKVFNITNSRFGADLPSYDFIKGVLWYSDYTLNGYKPAFTSVNTFQQQNMSSLSNRNYPWKEVIDSVKFRLPDSLLIIKEYQPKRYPQLLHAINFHSWAPFYIDQDDLLNMKPKMYPGITLFSQNKLSTVTGQFNYFYNEGRHNFKSVLTILAFYPVIDINNLISDKPLVLNQPENYIIPDSLQTYWQTKIGLRVPFNLTSNRYYRYIIPRLTFNYTNLYLYSRTEELMKGISYLEAGISAGNVLKSAYRDIGPRFGQIISLGWHNPLKNPLYKTAVYVGNYIQYVPGVYKHHSIRLEFLYKGSEENRMPLTDHSSLPRGINVDYYRTLGGSVEYAFPVAYPDISVGPVAYLKRIHASLYYEGAKIKYFNNALEPAELRDDYLSSFGIIIAAELHLLRFFIPLQPNFRFSYLPDKKKFNVGFDVFVDLDV